MHGNEVSAATGLLAVAIWIYLSLGRGSFWRLNNCALRKSAAQRSPASPIAVVVPARNEAAVIGRSLESLLQQSYSGAVDIFVVDDGSSDGTAQVAMQAPKSPNHSRVVTVIAGEPLPPGWTGKPWAV